MPVATSIPIRHFSQDDFGNVAYEVVGHACEIHGALGRIFHESVYRSTLQQILSLRAVKEMEIVLKHQCFQKELYVDLVVDSGCPFELKVASSLNSAHESQLIQYLMLTGLSHGKLINFGAERVEHQFVNCHEPPEQRRQFQIERHDWCVEEPARRFEDVLVPLVRDWGTGLTRSLYLEAVFELLGGADQCRRSIDTFRQQQYTDRQPVNVVDDLTAFEITCKRRDLEQYEPHLQRFLMNTNLDSILWANTVSGCVRLQRIGRVEERAKT